MANRISQLLRHWSLDRDKYDWVLATIVETDGSSYRKPGAMMLINDMGQYFGLLSGGCLESDIMRQARRCWDNQKNRLLTYDMREEEDLAWQLGIGCGGMVKILLQPIHAENNYLSLDELDRALEQRHSAYYQQVVDENAPDNQLFVELVHQPDLGLSTEQDKQYFKQKLTPTPLLAVFGGGVDAKPIVAIAGELGWQVIVIDPRTGYAKAEYFKAAHAIIRHPIAQLNDAKWLGQLDAALVLTHNIQLDADSIKLLQTSSAKYLGLLGPEHRTDRVLQKVGVTIATLRIPLANPAGLRLGGELPESIALSMLAEAHAVLEQADAKSISGYLNL